MPTFKITTDVDGEANETVAEFASEKAAADDAQRGLADALREKLPDGSHAAFSARVEDQKGAELYRASLDFRAKDAAEIKDEQRQADKAAQLVANAIGKSSGPP